ncbi:MAG: threonine-phosphate decarboxylase [Nitrospirales bacterium]|nr:threonine-phosphate decarboxylase [Nitrospirales bacterium]
MIHGGNIYKAAAILGMDEREIIDFSASINPLGIPASVRTAIQEHMVSIDSYPDPDTTRLTERIASFHNISPDSILCGNGSTELIYLIPRAVRPKKVLITAPTFSEYERACRLAGAEVIRHRLKPGDNFDVDAGSFIADMQNSGADMAFLCTPNNPTGRLVGKADVLQIAEAARKLRCLLVVDEAFMDFIPHESVIDSVKANPFLIVLRSMTKFYAIPGLRLGYGVFHPELVNRVRESREPWTVGTLAQKAGIAALDDDRYREETFRTMKEEKEFMEKGLTELGLSYVPSAVNYYLMKVQGAKNLVMKLRGKGILLRDCSSFAGLDESFTRIAVKSRAHNITLLREMEQWKQALS